MTAGAEEEKDCQIGEGDDWSCDDDETEVKVFEIALDDESVDEEDAEDDMLDVVDVADWLIAFHQYWQLN